MKPSLHWGATNIDQQHRAIRGGVIIYHNLTILHTQRRHVSFSRSLADSADAESAWTAVT